jgi:hypothetical protein
LKVWIIYAGTGQISWLWSLGDNIQQYITLYTHKLKQEHILEP